MSRYGQEPAPLGVQAPLSGGGFLLFVGGLVCGIVLMAFVLPMLVPVRAPSVVSQGGISIVATPSGPAPTPVGKTREAKTLAVVTAVHTVSRLETKEFDVEQDATKVRDPAFLEVFGGESIQAHVVGTVIGRTDLGQMNLSSDLRSGDITISEDGKQISIVLPCAEIANPILNWDKTQFPAYSYGLFSKPDPALWMTAMKAAAQGLVDKAAEMNIRGQANEEAKRQIATLVNLGGDFDKVFTQTGACK